MGIAQEAHLKSMKVLMDQHKVPCIMVKQNDEKVMIINSQAEKEGISYLDVKMIDNNQMLKIREQLFHVDIKKIPFQDDFFNLYTLNSQKEHHKIIINDSFYLFPLPTIILDDNINIIAVNEGFSNMFGYRHEDLYLKKISAIFKKIENHYSYINNILKTRKKVDVETTILDKSGNSRQVTMSVSHFGTNQDKSKGYFLILDDKEEEDNKEIHLLKQVLETLDDAVLITDEDFKSVWCNKTYKDLNKGFIQGSVTDFCAVDLNSEISQAIRMAQLKESGKWQGEAWFRSLDESITPVWLNIYALKEDENRTLFVASYKNLSKMDGTGSANILNIMRRDPLTALYNKIHFIDRVTTRLKMEQDLNHYVLFIDIDDFKIVNDTYGHSIGDHIIESFAGVLRKVFSGHFTSRYAGDEFLVYFGPDNDEKDIYNLIDNFRKEIKNKFMVKEIEINIDASFGLASYPENGKTLNEMLIYADKMMYEDKKNRKK